MTGNEGHLSGMAANTCCPIKHNQNSHEMQCHMCYAIGCELQGNII